MRAAIHHAHGGPEVLVVEEVADPVPGPGEVLIAVRATTLNRLDVLQRVGPALIPGFRLPHTAGLDVAGEVVDLGPDVGTVRRGDRVVVNPALECGECPVCRSGDDGKCPNTRVVGGNRPGGYAELCVVPASHVYAIPEQMSFEEAATYPTTYSTAWHALLVVGGLRLGETLLVHAAASGVSVAAIQLAKRCGASVIATAGSEEKLALATRLGADVVVNNRTGDFVAACREATDGRGVDIVFEHVGPALFGPSLYALRANGRMVFCGTTTGMQATFDLPFAYHFGLRLLGVDPYGAAEFGEMLAFCLTAGFDPVIGSRHALADARAAQEEMERGDVAGKIVLIP